MPKVISETAEETRTVEPAISVYMKAENCPPVFAPTFTRA